MRHILISAVVTAGSLYALPQIADAQDEADSQAAKTQRLIDMVQRRPDGVDRDAWREDRREAARQLGSIGDKKAVPALIEVAKSEQFDAVGQIAIVSLGKIGDDRAVDILQEIAADSSRDRFVRKSARDALRKLGASPAEARSNDDDDDENTLASTGLSAGLIPSSYAGPVSLVSDFGDDMLAASDRLTFAIGDSHVSYDSAASEASIDGQAVASFVRIRERKTMALRYEGRGSVLAGAVDFDGDDSSARLASLNIAGSAEARFYTGKAFGIGIGSAILGADYLRINRPGLDNTTKETLFSGEIALGLGGGYGRVLDIGESLRVKRIEVVLRKRKLLGRSITPDLAERIMRAWWQLRDEQGYHNRLVATVSLLREAGVLLAEPDAGGSYAILQVLSDGQLVDRPEGLQVYAAIGESLLSRDDDLGLEEGRIETLFSKATYGQQSKDGRRELRVDATARLRILAEDGESSPWAIGAVSHWRNYRYGKNSDPSGALDIGAEIGASSDGGDNSEIATRLAGSLGWLWAPSRASRFRFAGEMRYESSEMFLGLVFEGQYGLIDAGYIGSAANIQ